VRDLVLRYGWNTSAYQILNPGIEHWMAPRARGVVGFVRRPKRWIAAGAPVCEPGELPRVASEFATVARERGDSRVCYFCAMDRLRDAAAELGGHACIAIGSQPVWDPRDWPDIVRRRSSLRAQLNRARNKGIDVAAIESSALDGLKPALRDVLDDWVTSRPMPPMHFLTEPDTLDGVLADRLVYVARRDAQPVAFLVASPVPLRRGYLIEQIARGRCAPNGTAELLIDACMRDLASRDCAYVTQGLVALSPHAQAEIRRNPLWLRALMAWARAHGNRFYHFRGLEQFRQKMQPQRWETIYAIANEPHFTPATLHAVAHAFCGQSPARMLGRSMGKAARQELEWFKRRWRRAG
jgi:phosphatidylglycerol lysyltransferase